MRIGLGGYSAPRALRNPTTASSCRGLSTGGKDYRTDRTSELRPSSRVEVDISSGPILSDLRTHHHEFAAGREQQAVERAAGGTSGGESGATASHRRTNSNVENLTSSCSDDRQAGASQGRSSVRREGGRKRASLPIRPYGEDIGKCLCRIGFQDQPGARAHHYAGSKAGRRNGGTRNPHG